MAQVSFHVAKGSLGRQVTNVSCELTRWRTNGIGITPPVATPAIPFNQMSFLVQSSGKCPYLRHYSPGRRPVSPPTGSIESNLLGIDVHSQPVVFRPKATARKAGSAGLLSTSKLSNSGVKFPSFAFAGELSRDRVHSTRVQYSMAISCRNGSGGRKRPERKNLTKAARCDRRV
jgi:hypothetical protein